MCGRANLPTVAAIEAKYNVQREKNLHRMRTGGGYVSPGNWVTAIGHSDDVDGTSLGTLLWGFQPETGSYYNARFETIHLRPMWRDIVKTQRCVLPLTAFTEGGHEFSTGGILSAAAIYDSYNGFPVLSVVTVPAQTKIAVYHPRMPLLLTRTGVDAWLDPSVQIPNHITEIGTRHRLRGRFKSNHQQAA